MPYRHSLHCFSPKSFETISFNKVLKNILLLLLSLLFEPLHKAKDDDDNDEDDMIKGKLCRYYNTLHSAYFLLCLMAAPFLLKLFILKYYIR